MMLSIEKHLKKSLAKKSHADFLAEFADWKTALHQRLCRTVTVDSALAALQVYSCHAIVACVITHLQRLKKPMLLCDETSALTEWCMLMYRDADAAVDVLREVR
jgi:hypothetical protein